jgi:type IV secretion system protein VirD4
MLPIIQSPAQLVEVYGKEAAETFQTNHALQIIYPPKASETQTARDVSEWLGYQTVKGVSESKAKGFSGKRSPTESHSDQRRALMLPQEITSLGKGRELVVMEDLPPILARKVVYFKDHAFVDRLKSVSGSLRDLGERLPNKEQLDHAIALGELAADVPLIDLEAHHRFTGGDEPVTATAAKKPDVKKTFIERPVTADDIPSLAKRALADFAIDFSGIERPRPGDLDVAALNAYADNLSVRAGIKVHSNQGSST